MSHFKRPALAQDIAQELLGKKPFSDAANGLFLAAPRRTGKTDFLRHDLAPALQAEGVLVVYVDLWANKNRSPMDLIAEQLAQEVVHSLPLVAKFANGAGLQALDLGGIKIDTSKIGKTDGMTLYQVLALIRKQSGKRIALIIDEAQHALTTPEGDATMSALKSARDQLKDGGDAGLLLVMSGSHRDKLMRLLDTPATPFWGSQVSALPTLGQPYVKWLVPDMKSAIGAKGEINLSDLTQSFELAGERPQFFAKALKQAVDHPDPAQSFGQQVLGYARNIRQHDRDGMNDLFLALPPLEQALLWRVLDKGEAFKPFDAQALAFYSRHAGKTISAAQAQKAIERMRDHDPPLIWKSLRGEYSIYDMDMVDWYTYLVAQQAWPPRAASTAPAQ